MLATPMRAKPSSDAHARTSASSAEASKELLAVEVLTRKGYAVAPYNGEWAAPDATGPCIVEPEIHTAARVLPDRIHTRRRRGDRGAGERARPYVSGRRDGSGEPASGGRSGRRQDHLRPQLPALTCVHVDLYRLNGPEEVEELGLRDFFGADCLLLVEWASKGTKALPPPDIDLALSFAEPGRQARLRARGPLGEGWLEDLRNDTRLIPYLSNLT